jgi:hypothetical protein
MLSVLLPLAAALMMSATAAIADNKFDCQKGVAMIKAELKKKHSAPVRHVAQGAQRAPYSSYFFVGRSTGGLVAPSAGA